MRVLALLAVGVVVFAGVAHARQGDLSSRVAPVTVPLRKAAMRLDRATGRFHRVPTTATLGPGTSGIVYDNSCPSGYYMLLQSGAGAGGGSQAEVVIDQGRIPNTASPSTALCTPGTHDDYEIFRWEIAYCTTTGSSVTLITHFWDPPMGACNNIVGGTSPPVTATVASITVTGMPRSSSAGMLACYLVQIQLGTPGFTLTGGANSATGRFAWSAQYPTTTGSDGPLIAGNPTFGGCAPCVSTVFEAGGQTTNPGTGLDSVDAFYLDSYGGTTDGCFFFGGVPYASFYDPLEAVDVAPTAVGTPFCDGVDLSLCPCSNPGQVDSGCEIAQSTGGALLTVTAQDTGANTAQMTGTGFPPMSTPTAIVIRGNNLEPTAVPFGDGLRCVGLIGFARLAATAAVVGTSVHDFGHGAGPGVYAYQVWFRNTPASYCVTTGPSSGAFNLTNGQLIAW